MRGFHRQTVVWSLVLLFAASGFTARYCMAAHHSAGHTVAVAAAEPDNSHHAHASHGADAQHDHGGTQHQHAADGEAPVATDDIACAKCCGTCTLANGVLPSAAQHVAFAAYAAVFDGEAEHRMGTTVRVDPGIPKPIV
jgi:hypothetical protein